MLVAAAVALGRRVTLTNVPEMGESRVLQMILDRMGATGSIAGHVWDLDTTGMRSRPVPSRLSGLIHGSLYLVPALLARFGEVSFVEAGGDRIGPKEQGGRRPTEQVAAVLERFGATVSTAGGFHATARRLRGCSIDLMEFSDDRQRLRGPRACSATKTALILAAVSQGTTRLRHPVDRDVTRELCDFLRTCGAIVTQDDDTWCIQAGATNGDVSHRLLSDSTSIVTYVAAAVQAGGSLRLTGITGTRTWRAMSDELRVLGDMGVQLSMGAESLHVHGRGEIRPVDLEIECNGFSTDVHPILAVPLLSARGTSRITDHVWSSRFAYTSLLKQMGARIEVNGNTVRLHPSDLRPSSDLLRPTDSRAAAAAVIAALGPSGPTAIVDTAGHLDRSYEAFAPALRSAGASIEESSMDRPWPASEDVMRYS